MTLRLATAAATLTATDDVLRIHEGAHTAAITLSEDERATLSAWLLGTPQLPALPDGLSPAGHAIAVHLSQAFEALAELAKVRGSETDVLLRLFVRHVGSWRGWCLKEAA